MEMLVVVEPIGKTARGTIPVTRDHDRIGFHHARGRKRREDQERDEQLGKGEALLGGTPRRRETASHPARLAIVSVAGKPLAPRTAISILSTPPPRDRKSTRLNSSP